MLERSLLLWARGKIKNQSSPWIGSSRAQSPDCAVKGQQAHFHCCLSFHRESLLLFSENICRDYLEGIILFLLHLIFFSTSFLFSGPTEVGACSLHPVPTPQALGPHQQVIVLPRAPRLEAGAGPGAQFPINLKLFSYILTLFVHGYQPCSYWVNIFL